MIERTSKEYVLKILEKNHNNWNILDIGCNRDAVKFAQTVADVVDFSNFYKDIKFILINSKDLPFKDNEFDLVISLGCLHNLRLMELEVALGEIERVGKQGYVMLESYRNEAEQFNLQCWALTCESFFDNEEWPWIYDHFGYTGDYEFIYFE